MEKCFIVILQCFILSIIYVSSLYVWKYRHERDHPSTIKRRFISVTVVALISPIYFYFCLDKKYFNRFTLWSLLGLRTVGLWQAVIYPLLLTSILFLGPITIEVANGYCNIFTDKEYWRSNLFNLEMVRNLIVGPLTEELTYRACMVPLILQCFHQVLTVFICPVFFGTAHFNHLLENLRAGLELKKSFLNTGFKFLHTTIFGIYSTFLFLRTGHLSAPIIAHMFCNYMGFPEISELLHHSGFKRYTLIFSFFFGLAAWCLLLMPLTEPSLYYNTIYWNQNYSTIRSS